MAFSDWTTLENQMKNDFATGSWKVASYTVDGKSMQYRSMAEFTEAFNFVKHEAALERGEISMRTYAAHGRVGS